MLFAIILTRRVVDNRAARSNRACAIRRDHIIFKTAHWSRIDRALIAHWLRLIAYWSRIDRALIAHFWSRLITPDRALITPDRALIAHWSRIDRAWSRIDRALIAHFLRDQCAIRRDQARSGEIKTALWSRLIAHARLDRAARSLYKGTTTLLACQTSKQLTHTLSVSNLVMVLFWSDQFWSYKF